MAHARRYMFFRRDDRRWLVDRGDSDRDRKEEVIEQKEQEAEWEEKAGRDHVILVGNGAYLADDREAKVADDKEEVRDQVDEGIVSAVPGTTHTMEFKRLETELAALGELESLAYSPRTHYRVACLLLCLEIFVITLIPLGIGLRASSSRPGEGSWRITHPEWLGFGMGVSLFIYVLGLVTYTRMRAHYQAIRDAPYRPVLGQYLDREHAGRVVDYIERLGLPVTPATIYRDMLDRVAEQRLQLSRQLAYYRRLVPMVSHAFDALDSGGHDGDEGVLFFNPNVAGVFTRGTLTRYLIFTYLLGEDSEEAREQHRGLRRARLWCSM